MADNHIIQDYGSLTTFAIAVEVNHRFGLGMLLVLATAQPNRPTIDPKRPAKAGQAREEVSLADKGVV